MKRKKLLFLSILFFPFLLNAAPKGEGNQNSEKRVTRKGLINPQAGTPTRAILDIEDKMKQYKTGASLTGADQSYNATLKRNIINGAFDLRELCKRSLDKHWEGRSEAQRNEFVGLMTRILEQKALFSNEQSKTKGKSYEVTYQGDTYSNANKDAVSKIVIRIPRDNTRVNLSYRFRKLGSEWKIYDVVVDEASLVDNYRYQFNSIITKNGYAELVNRMRKKLSQLDSRG